MTEKQDKSMFALSRVAKDWRTPPLVQIHCPQRHTLAVVFVDAAGQHWLQYSYATRRRPAPVLYEHREDPPSQPSTPLAMSELPKRARADGFGIPFNADTTGGLPVQCAHCNQPESGKLDLAAVWTYVERFYARAVPQDEPVRANYERVASSS